jgi:hypothetical protein
MKVRVVIRKALLTHPRRISPIPNSDPIDGRATLTDEAIKGRMKQLTAATKMAALFGWEALSLVMIS